MNSSDERAGAADHNSTVAEHAFAARDLITAARNWSTIMGFLMVRELNARSRTGKLSLLIMVAEPFILIVTFYLIRGLFRGMVQEYGESLFLFLASGLLPFYLFMRASIQVRRGQLKPGQRLPRIHSLDLFMAATAAHASVFVAVIGATFFGMWIYGIEQARPVSVVDCAGALFFLLILGAGLGLVHSVIARFFQAWPVIIGYATRGMIFLSGVIHIAAFYRPGVREWIAWNPILHGVDWFRLGVYGSYPVLLLDPFYLVKSAIIVLFIGIVADRATLRYGGK